MGDVQYTTPEEVTAKLATLRTTFQKGVTKDLRWRKWQLKQLWWLVEDNEAAILAALKADIGRHELEVTMADIGSVKNNVLLHLKNLEEWTADEYPDAGIVFGKLGTTRLRKEPLGVVLIIGAWNFPFLLVMEPLVAAIAAGCTAMLKPSELTPAVQALVQELIPRYLDTSAVSVVTGGIRETTFILEQKFDHIFFTGSPGVGKIVAAAAAKHLTPTVLELGGQAPGIVTASADVDLAAKRIVYAKFLNAGQVCLSVNHVFVAPEVHDIFIERAIFWTRQFGGEEEFKDMSNIVNGANYDRLKDYLDRSQGQVLTKGTFDRAAKRMPITLIDGVKMTDSLLEAELFGPLLPIIIKGYEEAVIEIAALPHPLGLYIFSNSRKEIDYILNHTISGGVTINDVMLHAGAPNTPFGGVGNSGSGAYHGKYGVDAFTHKRAVVSLPNFLDKVMGFRYPPYFSSNKAKVAVKNSLGFKRGEGIAAQRIRNPGQRKAIFDAFLYAFVVLALAGKYTQTGRHWVDAITTWSSQTLYSILGRA